MNNDILPNGGFPPITLCTDSKGNDSKGNDSKGNDSKGKGFFFSNKTNNLNIRNILNKKHAPFIESADTEEDLKVVDSI